MISALAAETWTLRKRLEHGINLLGQRWSVAATAPVRDDRDAGRDRHKPDQAIPSSEIIEQGNSFGAFENDELIGWAICDYRQWNNSLFIENILISEKFRRKNIGKLFIKNISRKAREL